MRLFIYVSHAYNRTPQMSEEQHVIRFSSLTQFDQCVLYTHSDSRVRVVCIPLSIYIHKHVSHWHSYKFPTVHRIRFSSLTHSLVCLARLFLMCICICPGRSNEKRFAVKIYTKLSKRAEFTCENREEETEMNRIEDNNNKKKTSTDNDGSFWRHEPREIMITKVRSLI